MLPQSWPKLVAIFLGLILFVALLQAWRADRRDRAQLAAELAATKQLLTAADARQHARDAQLQQTLAQLAAEKRSVVSPAQILRDLPKAIPLPAPITLQADRTSSVGAALGPPAANASAPETHTDAEPFVGATPACCGRLASPVATTSPSNQKPPVGAVIPDVDLKPLYDFALDCQACQAKLSAAQNDLADERQKTVALTKERDDAVRIAKGGSAWRRVARAAKWFFIGAAVGAIAAKTAH